MRSHLTLALILLVVVLVGGAALSMRASHVSDTFVEASEDLRAHVLSEQWDEAARRLTAYRLAWEELLPGLQMQIDHDAADDVTLAMETIDAGLRAHDMSLALLGCNQLEESARHLYHRDAFTLSNIL